MLIAVIFLHYLRAYSLFLCHQKKKYHLIYFLLEIHLRKMCNKPSDFRLYGTTSEMFHV